MEKFKLYGRNSAINPNHRCIVGTPCLEDPVNLFHGLYEGQYLTHGPKGEVPPDQDNCGFLRWTTEDGQTYEMTWNDLTPGEREFLEGTWMEKYFGRGIKELTNEEIWG